MARCGVAKVGLKGAGALGKLDWNVEIFAGGGSVCSSSLRTHGMCYMRLLIFC